MVNYERPVPLDRQRHLRCRVQPMPGHDRFAAKTNAVPLTCSEFAAAACHYPIVFVGTQDGPLQACALVGLREHENLAIDAAGQWAADAYIPAFVRRYPFVLARVDDTSSLTVCIDEAYDGLGEMQGERLFDDEGNESPYLSRVLGFLRAFQLDYQRTGEFAARLRQLGLLVPRHLHVDRPDLPRQTLTGLWVVDRGNLGGIDDARIVELFRAGQLSWIESHLLSLGQLRRLVAKLDACAPTSVELAASVS